jgi:hypothetical protein
MADFYVILIAQKNDPTNKNSCSETKYSDLEYLTKHVLM